MELRAWFEAQDTFTLHRPIPRNPYSMNKITNDWEYDLVDLQGLSKYNDGIKYLFNVIDVFSIYLNVVPLKSKTAPSVTSTFQSVLKVSKYSKSIRRRPVWVQKEGGKNF